MKALHIITGLGVGGAEQQLRLLLRHLPVACDVVTLTHPGPVAAGLAADGVRVTHLGMTGNRDLSALPRLARLIRRGRYDLVHTHLYRACLYGRIAARLAGVRAVVATEHSLGDSQMEGRPITAGVRGLYLLGERLGRSTVAVSPTVAARLARWGVPAPRVTVVPNGIELARFAYDPAARLRTREALGLPAAAFVIGAVGRLAPGKRFDVLIRSLAQLPDDCRLLLVGAGPQEPVLRRTAHAAGVAGRVVFAGERPYLADGSPGAPWGPDLPALASAMDVLAAPSAEEAFGLAVVEGLAAGLPVRYTSCPALEDLPPEAAPGAVRVPCDAAAYARALAGVRAAGPGPRTAPEAARHYCITRSAARLMDVYAAALATSRPTVGAPVQAPLQVPAPGPTQVPAHVPVHIPVHIPVQQGAKSS